MSTIYTLNGKVLKNSANDKWLIKKETPVDPYNPLGLPPFTIRCKFKSGYTPSMGDSQTLVDAGENVWDITANGTTYKSWNGLFRNNTNLIEVIGANGTGVTRTDEMFRGCSSLSSVALFDIRNVSKIYYMFYDCTSITSVPLFDTSSCTNMSSMFDGCRSLTTVPLFDTTSCTNMSSMFSGCRSLTTVPLFDTTSCTNMNLTFNNCFNVQSGALALYQQASTQATPPTSHSSTFSSCGYNTVTGAAELAQIPSSWGGTGA